MAIEPNVPQLRLLSLPSTLGRLPVQLCHGHCFSSATMRDGKMTARSLPAGK